VRLLFTPVVGVDMRDRYGTLDAIERLVQSGEIQSGFKKLEALNKIDWTIEAAVLKFSNEFSPTARECSEFRLRLAKMRGSKFRATRPAEGDRHKPGK
jgi:hypothetical protein